MTLYPLFATTPKAMENLLADEISALGGQDIRLTVAGVSLGFGDSLSCLFMVAHGESFVIAAGSV